MNLSASIQYVVNFNFIEINMNGFQLKHKNGIIGVYISI